MIQHVEPLTISEVAELRSWTQRPEQFGFCAPRAADAILRLLATLDTARSYAERMDALAEERLAENTRLSATIHQLTERLENGWISVSERMPEDDGDELVLVNLAMPRGVTFGRVTFGNRGRSGACDLARYVAGSWYFESLGDAPNTSITVTHWMPLPDPPTERLENK